MKFAVIRTGSKQYLVKEGELLDIELIGQAKKVEFEPLLIIDGAKVTVGTPIVNGVKATGQVVETDVKGAKVKIMKFKAKKRVKKLTGHRQHFSRVKISSIGK